MLASRRDVFDGGGEEVGGFEDFEVALGAPTAAGAVDDGPRFRVSMDFLEGEWGSQQMFRESLAAFGVAGSDGLFPTVDVEAAVFPREEIGDLLGAEVFFVAKDLEEAVAEEFGDGGEAFLRNGVEAPLLIRRPTSSSSVTASSGSTSRTSPAQPASLRIWRRS